jgi:hypothetical protein
MLALFDFLVAATASFALAKSRRSGIAGLFSVTGFALIALAAVVGTLKYAFLPHLAPQHKLVSHIAGVVGVPFAALGFFHFSVTMYKWTSGALAVILVAAAYIFWTSASYALGIGIVAQLIWLWAGWLQHRRGNPVLLRVLISVILTSAAGLFFAGPGELWGTARENIFHACLAIALAQQGFAFGDILRTKQDS